MRDIGKNIRDLRIQRNMTQDELAEKLFVTRQTVSNYETGKSRPDIEMLERIAEVLEKHYKDMQLMEFTIENNKLYILQTKTAKRTAECAVYAAVDMVEEVLIS